VPNIENKFLFISFSLSLMDRVRQLTFQEFLNLLSRVLENLKTMLSRVKVSDNNDDDNERSNCK
jgi:hypothetical protein